METIKRKRMSQRKPYRPIDQINFLRFVGACKSLIELENDAEARKANAGKAPQAAEGAAAPAGAQPPQLPIGKTKSTKALDSSADEAPPPEMTPRSTGPQLMRRAKETVINKLIKSKPNPALNVMKLLSQGKTLSDMLKESQTVRYSHFSFPFRKCDVWSWIMVLTCSFFILIA